jgi:hypothetical protein
LVDASVPEQGAFVPSNGISLAYIYGNSGAIVHGSHTFLMRATGAAEERPTRFDSVADDSATTMFTLGRQCVDGAFETVEIMGDPVDNDLEGFVVFVTANFATHRNPFRS